MHGIFEAVADKVFDAGDVQRFSDTLWGVTTATSGLLLFDDGVRSGVATTPLIIDQIDVELITHVGWMNADMPTGQVYLRHHQTQDTERWTATYCFRALNTWLDMNGQGVLQMVLDMVGSAAQESEWVVAQLEPLGMVRVDPRSRDYFSLVMQTI